MDSNVINFSEARARKLAQTFAFDIGLNILAEDALDFAYSIHQELQHLEEDQIDLNVTITKNEGDGIITSTVQVSGLVEEYEDLFKLIETLPRTGTRDA